MHGDSPKSCLMAHTYFQHVLSPTTSNITQKDPASALNKVILGQRTKQMTTSMNPPKQLTNHSLCSQHIGSPHAFMNDHQLSSTHFY